VPIEGPWQTDNIATKDSTRETRGFTLETRNRTLLDSRIQHALDLIHGTANGQFAVAELAQKVGLSASYFQHLFRRETGVSPARYVQDLKLREAAHLLKTTTVPIKDVLRVVGVSDPSHFIRKFRRMYGAPPSLYRCHNSITTQETELRRLPADGSH
jgi:transcriptional regulator GlxA family with amidase domain